MKLQFWRHISHMIYFKLSEETFKVDLYRKGSLLHMGLTTLF